MKYEMLPKTLVIYSACTLIPQIIQALLHGPHSANSDAHEIHARLTSSCDFMSLIHGLGLFIS